MRGNVKKYFDDRGFGFIRQESGEDIFFHHSQIAGERPRKIVEGQAVSFEIGRGRKGKPEATIVTFEE